MHLLYMVKKQVLVSVANFAKIGNLSQFSASPPHQLKILLQQQHIF